MNPEAPIKSTIARNPLRDFLYGTAWLVVALAVGSVLIYFTAAGPSLSDAEGQRTVGFIITVPFIALAISIFCFIRGGLAVSAYKSYINSTTPEQRLQHQKNVWKNQGPPVGLLIAFTGTTYLSFIILLILLVVHNKLIFSTAESLGSFLGILILVGIVASALTELTVKILRVKQK